MVSKMLDTTPGGVNNMRCGFLFFLLGGGGGETAGLVVVVLVFVLWLVLWRVDRERKSYKNLLKKHFIHKMDDQHTTRKHTHTQLCGRHCASVMFCFWFSCCVWKRVLKSLCYRYNIFNSERSGRAVR